MRRQWTEEEVEYLEKNYEKRGVDYIAKKLNRTPQSIKRKAQKLRYNAYLCEDLYLKTVAKCFNSDSLVINRWIKLGLSYKIVQRGQSTCKLISANNFWKWAEQNKDIIPWSKYERYSILPEPKWLEDTIDAYTIKNNRKKITFIEIQQVIHMREKGVSFEEIAKTLSRTVNSIKHIWRNRERNDS